MCPLQVLPGPTASPSPRSTLDPVAQKILRFLALRNAAQRSEDGEAVLELLDSGAPAKFRERELQLARIARERGQQPPARKLVWYEGGLALPLGLLVASVIETDDQPRSRAVRYFFNLAGATRLTEPAPDALGPLRTRSGADVDVYYRTIDAQWAEVAGWLAAEGLVELLARLGEGYRPQRRLSVTLVPTTVSGLPPVASGFVNDGRVTLLSSHSMVTDTGAGAEWARTVVVHEIAHAILLPHGRGPFLLVEGIPLWLTDDRRRSELDRVVYAHAAWRATLYLPVGTLQPRDPIGPGLISGQVGAEAWRDAFLFRA